MNINDVQKLVWFFSLFCKKLFLDMFEPCIMMHETVVYVVGTVALIFMITMLMLAARGRVQNNRFSLLTMAVIFESGDFTFDNDVVEYNDMETEATIPSRG